MKTVAIRCNGASVIPAGSYAVDCGIRFTSDQAKAAIREIAMEIDSDQDVVGFLQGLLKEFDE